MTDYSKIVLLALKAALKAKSEILEVYDNRIDVEIKDDGTPLTLADKNSNNAIVKLLNQSNIPVLSEESSLLPYSRRKDAEYLWLVDPLDGTKEFIKKNGEFTINIGLIHNSEPVIGVTAVPVSNIIYLGWKGEGAFKIKIKNDFENNLANNDIKSILKNSVKLSVNNKIDKIVLAASRSHPDEIAGRLIQLLSKEGITASFLKRGSALKFGLIADGTANIYIRGSYSYEWDTASGHALVNAAGGEVISVGDGKPLKYNKPQLKNKAFIAIASEELMEIISDKLTL